MANNKKVLLKRSNVVENGTPKLPTAAQLEYGELAMNYANGYETLSFKNSNNEVVKFESSEKMKTYVDTKVSEAISSNPEEVFIGTSAPTGQNKPDIFVDLTVDPLVVEVYNKTEIDNKLQEITDAMYTGPEEVFIGNTTPTGEETPDIFVDLSVDPVTTEIYSKAQIDEKLDSTVSLNTTSNGTSILIDENAGDSIEVYTRAQVDAIIAQLKADNNLK